MCKIVSYWEPAIKHRKLNSVFCEDLEKWGSGGGSKAQEDGIYIYINNYTPIKIILTNENKFETEIIYALNKFFLNVYFIKAFC